MGGGGRRQLRRRVVKRTRCARAEAPWGARRRGEVVRAHPRDEPQEARDASVGVQRPVGLRPHLRERQVRALWDFVFLFFMF